LGQQEGTGNTARKPQLAHLKAYGCRAYAMTKDAQLKRKRLLKLDPQAYIGYLVGYNFTNIYRIWVPYQGKVISTRDVIFDKKSHFNSKRESLTDMLIKEKDELIERAIMPEKLAANKSIVQEDNDLISLYNSKDKDTIVVDTGHLEIGQDSYEDTIVVNTEHLKIGQDSHDFVCNSSNWPTPSQSNPDDQDNTQYVCFASLLIRGRASPKGVEVSHS
jgi:hypothetical protein